MITAENGKVTVYGTVAEVMADLEFCIRGVKRALEKEGVSKEAVDKMVSDAICGADMTPEERVKDLLSAIFKELFEALK